MATYTSDQINKATTEGADHFVKSFYPALQNNRKTLASYYAQPTTSILFNGNPVANGTAVQEIFEQQMPPAHYEVQSFDCQPLNPNYPTSLSSASATTTTEKDTKPRHGDGGVLNISMLVTVSGFVQFGELRDLPSRGFSETFVLVPNPQAQQHGGRKDPRMKKHLIQSQNFRLVV